MTSLFESLNTHGTESVVDEAVLEVIEKEFDKMVCCKHGDVDFIFRKLCY